jgi:hypothetical protein
MMRMPRSGNERSRWRRPAVVIAMSAAISLAACGRFKVEADARFGDQHCKTAIALIELYHVRHNVYPASLADLDFVGDWDAIARSSGRGSGYGAPMCVTGRRKDGSVPPTVPISS